MEFLLFFIPLILSYRDIRDGLEYEDSTMKRLIGSYSGTKSVFVRASVETIKGGSEAKDGFAYSFRSTLKNLTFEENGNLSVIEKSSFQQTSQLKLLNLSMCKKLKTIQSFAFDGSGIETLILPIDGVFESTESFSFQSTKVKSIIYPKSMKTVGHSMFKYAYDLTDVSFEDNSICTTIQDYAFETSGIVRIFIPKSVSSLSAKCFALCKKLSEIQVEYGSEYFVSEYNILYRKGYSSFVCFPRAWNIDLVVRDGVTHVLDEAFRSCSVKSIVFPASLQYVGYNIVTDCSQLILIEFKDGVESMSQYALQNCQIMKFVVPASLSYLNNYLLTKCSALKEVIIHSNVTKIMEGCFKGCTSLELIEIPEGNLESIFIYAFRDCVELKNVILPTSVTSLGGGLFENCHPNLSVQFRGGRFETDENRIIYAEEKSIVVQMYAEPSNSEIFLPSTVENISMGAFAGRRISSITFNSDIKHIEERAFAGCKYLEKFSFPSTIISLSSSIFAESNIKNISLNTIPYLPDETFRSCNMLENIIITPSVQSIGKKCFAYAANLKNIEFEEGLLNSISSEAFSYCKSLQSIVFPKSIRYLSSKIISGKSARSVAFEAGCLLESIPEEAFMDSASLDSILFPPNTITLEPYCLANCISLKKLNISKSIEILKKYCLSGCYNLEEITIEKGTKLRSIEDSALEGLKNLGSIILNGESEYFKTSDDCAILYTIKDSISKEEKEIVKYCGKSERKEFKIPNSVEIISGCSFEGAVNLERVVIGEIVKAIGARAFAGCISLRSIEIPKSVETVGVMVFEGCSNLTCGSVKYHSSLKEALKLSGLSEETLNKCITRDFTITSSFRMINSELASFLLVNNDE